MCKPDPDLPGVIIELPIPDSVEVSVWLIAFCLPSDGQLPRCFQVSGMVQVESVNVAGVTLGYMAEISVVRGILPPCSITFGCNDGMGLIITPCQLPSGALIIPTRCKDSGVKLLLPPDGSDKKALTVAELGVEDTTVAAVAFDEVTQTLFLAYEAGVRSRLIALDATCTHVKWATAPGTFADCCGVAVLPSHGVVVASSKNRGPWICAFRISDGKQLAMATAPTYVTYVAADPLEGVVYASTGIGCDPFIFVRSSQVPVPWALRSPRPQFLLQVYRWDYESLVQQAPLEAAGSVKSRRPMAVVPPAPGRRLSHLVVGIEGRTGVRVVALPAHTLVCEVAVLRAPDGRPILVQGLAAGTLGSSLVVCSKDEAHVLPWPLPGMPELE